MMKRSVSHAAIANLVPSSSGVLMGLDYLRGEQADMRDSLNEIITPVWDRASTSDDPVLWRSLGVVLECVTVRLYVRGSQDLARAVSGLVHKARLNESIVPLPY